MDLSTRAQTLLDLHTAPELLTVVNVWDAISTRIVTEVEGTKALATASHSIAASHGYEDGENIPVDEMIAAVGLIAANTHLPVTADLEAVDVDTVVAEALSRYKVAADNADIAITTDAPTGYRVLGDQPLLVTEAMTIVGLEALLRWNHP